MNPANGIILDVFWIAHVPQLQGVDVAVTDQYCTRISPIEVNEPVITTFDGSQLVVTHSALPQRNRPCPLSEKGGIPAL